MNIRKVFQKQEAVENELQHFYMLLEGTSNDNIKTQFGKVVYDKDYFPSKEVMQIEDYTTLSDLLWTTLNQPDTSQKLNIFIHGIWAHYPIAWEQMVEHMSRDIFHIDDKKKVILSIIWDSTLNYGTGVKIASQKGDILADFFTLILKSKPQDVSFNILAHSMGNRVFEHIINHCELPKEKAISQYISLAADVEDDIFMQGRSFDHLSDIVDRIYIYINKQDRALKISKFLNKIQRLGEAGPKNWDDLGDGIYVIDTSQVNDTIDFFGKIANHRYFYLSPTVKSNLKEIIWDDHFLENHREDFQDNLCFLKS